MILEYFSKLPHISLDLFGGSGSLNRGKFYLIEVGPVTYKNESNKNEFIKEIKKLRIRGGRDCLEMAFGGMLGAFTANPRLGSPMFVFTDAGPKDDSYQNREALKTLADQYGSTINFFTTPRGCGGSKGITKGNMKYTVLLKSLRNFFLYIYSIKNLQYVITYYTCI